MRIRSDPVFLDGSGSGFQIFLDPVSAQILEPKKIAERSLKLMYQIEENLKFMTKDRQKMKMATTISY